LLGRKATFTHSLNKNEPYVLNNVKYSYKFLFVIGIYFKAYVLNSEQVV